MLTVIPRYRQYTMFLKQGILACNVVEIGPTGRNCIRSTNIERKKKTENIKTLNVWSTIACFFLITSVDLFQELGTLTYPLTVRRETVLWQTAVTLPDSHTTHLSAGTRNPVLFLGDSWRWSLSTASQDSSPTVLGGRREDMPQGRWLLNPPGSCLFLVNIFFPCWV